MDRMEGVRSSHIRKSSRAHCTSFLATASERAGMLNSAARQRAWVSLARLVFALTLKDAQTFWSYRLKRSGLRRVQEPRAAVSLVHTVRTVQAGARPLTRQKVFVLRQLPQTAVMPQQMAAAKQRTQPASLLASQSGCLLRHPPQTASRLWQTAPTRCKLQPSRLQGRHSSLQCQLLAALRFWLALGVCCASAHEQPISVQISSTNLRQ